MAATGIDTGRLYRWPLDLGTIMAVVIMAAITLETVTGVAGMEVVVPGAVGTEAAIPIGAGRVEAGRVEAPMEAAVGKAVAVLTGAEAG